MDPKLNVSFVRNRIPSLKRQLPAFSEKNILHFTSDHMGPGEPHVDKDGGISHFHLAALLPYCTRDTRCWLRSLGNIYDVINTLETWILCKGVLTGDKIFSVEIKHELNNRESVELWGLHTIKIDYVIYLVNSRLVDVCALFHRADLLSIARD